MKCTCLKCKTPFTIPETDLAFYARISPTIQEKTYDIPPPTRCPDCRLQRRLAYRNQIFVFLRLSSKTGKSIFSMYPEDAPCPVIENDDWWSDSWDPLEYAMDFDFARPFFEQFYQLTLCVPHRPLTIIHSENSDYCNNTTAIKNCYLVFNSQYAEDCTYCENVWRSRDCMDCTRAPDSELCYDCVECARCYNVQSSLFSEDCHDSQYLLHCRSCSNCFACANLRRREYCLFNEQYSKEEYEGLVGKIAEHMTRTREWGEFFPLEHALIPYNYSYAQRYFPLTKEEAKDEGLHWAQKDERGEHQVTLGKNLPDLLPESDEPIVTTSVGSGKPFRITAHEIEFYRKIGVPLPRQTYDERMEERARRLGGIRLHRRNCDESGQEIFSTYDAKTPWPVWERDLYESKFSS